MIRTKRELRAIAGVLATLSGFGAAACGDGFTGDDCEASLTCAPGGSGAAGEATQNEAGSDGSVAGTESGGTEAGGSDSGPAAGQGGSSSALNPPPTVVAIAPAGDATDVGTDAVVVIELSEALDPNTVSPESVQLLDGEAVVEAEVSYADGKITITPSAPLALLAEYTVSVSTAVTDEEGAGLAADYTSTFATRDGAWTVTDVANSKPYVLVNTLPVTAKGEALVAWSAQTAVNIYCPTSARWFQFGEPMAPTKVFPVADGVLECTSVAVGGNAAGVAAVGWQKDFADAHVEQYRDGQWPAAATTPVSTVNSAYFSGVGVAHNGAVSLLQHGGGGTYARRSNAAGVWVGTAVDISPSHTGASAPRFAFDSQSNGFAVWRAEVSGKDEVRVARYTAADGWEPATTLPGSAAADNTATSERGAPAVAVDEQGGAIVLWLRESGGNGSVVANRYTANGGWGDPVTVSSTLVVVNMLTPPGLVFDGVRYVAAWTGKDGANHHPYSATFDLEFGEWDAHQPRSSAVVLARMPELGTDAHGNLLMTWLEGAGSTPGLVYARYDGRAGEWRDALEVPGASVKDDNIATSERPTPLGVGVNGHGAQSWADEDAQGSTVKLRIASFY